jgi:endonuclease YncB( thermonuclease family)
LKNPVQLKSRNLSTYQVLLAKVKRTLIEGQERIESERVRVYWKTGQLILNHILPNKDRADYGGQVLDHLARDLNVHVSVLRRCLKFHEEYPRLPIRARGHELSWSHYRKFITVADHKKRLLLEKGALEKSWSAAELAVKIKEEKPVFKPVLPASVKSRTIDNRPLTPLRGEFYTYQLVERPSLKAGQSSGLRVDLGFGVFLKVDTALLSRFSKGDIVEARPQEDIYKFYKSSRSAKDLYTYRAQVERVIDGDTVKVRFDLGFNVEVRETLRLRGIDCPEVDTKEGQAAKVFVQAHLKQEDWIVVRTSRSDKYDRYLADVFIPFASEEIYLNNFLLKQGHAARMD